jgi:hypothetical protein
MNIKKKLLQVQAAVALDKAKGSGGALGEAIGLAAERALTKGMESDEWKDYMALFADSAEQLQRLTTTDLDGTNAWLPRARAYIVANAICAPGTDTVTIKGVIGIGDIDVNKPDGTALDETFDQAVANRRAVNVPPLP